MTAPRALRVLRVLLTGFEPFDGELVNPSARLALALAVGPPPHPRLAVSAVVLPVDRQRMPAALAQALAEHRPDVVLALGQATGRPHIDLEQRAVNAIDFGAGTDNGGHRAGGENLHARGPDALDSSLPLAELADELRDAGHPVALSRDAGRHLCNALLYELLHRHPGVPAAFVHVPLLPEQSHRRGADEACLDEAVTQPCLTDLLHRLAERMLPGDA